MLDETAYQNALVEKLIGAEVLAADAVVSLGAARAAAVRAALLQNTALDATRITDGEPAQVPVASSGAVPMKLDLTVP